MVLRMCKVLAIPQSRSQSPRVILVERNKSNTDSGNWLYRGVGTCASVPILVWNVFFTSYAVVIIIIIIIIIIMIAIVKKDFLVVWWFSTEQM